MAKIKRVLKDSARPDRERMKRIASAFKANEDAFSELLDSLRGIALVGPMDEMVRGYKRGIQAAKLAMDDDWYRMYGDEPSPFVGGRAFL